MKILIIENADPSMRPIMRVTSQHIKTVHSVDKDAAVTVIKNTEEEKIRTALKTAQILITPETFLGNLPNAPYLAWIHVTSAGINTLPETIKQKNIIITNSSGVHPIPIAEHVFAFMLMFARKIEKSFRQQIENRAWKRSYHMYPTTELYGKTLGIVGLGRIGSRIARLAKAFDMQVIAVARNNKKHVTFVEKLVPASLLSEIVKNCDYVVNALPLTKETKHLFNKNIFKKMKKSAYYINIGRGGTTNEKDLVLALKNHTIAGTGLDVFEEEPLPSTSPLWRLSSAIITPHYSGWTPEYMNRVIDIFCINLRAYLEKKPMPNLVDKKKGY